MTNKIIQSMLCTKYKHFAYSQKYRTPVGGVELGQSLTLRLAIDDCPKAVNLVLTKDGEDPVHYPMDEVSFALDERTFENSIDILSSGLYFYHFEIVFFDQQTLTIGRDQFYGACANSQLEWELTVYYPLSQLPANNRPTNHANNSSTNHASDSSIDHLSDSSTDHPSDSSTNHPSDSSTNHPSDSSTSHASKAAIDSSSYNGGIIYQIFTDRFCKGEKRLKTKDYARYREDWEGVPEYGANGQPITNTDFFGGNLSGIISKLDYLKSLGVTMIYLNPIFEARSSHKYDTGNYLKIDPDFGSEEDFVCLIKKADQLGIGIILDGVFSHTGDDSIYFNKYNNYDSIGAYQSKDSAYYEWYDFSDFPNNYASWWGIDTLPNVNETNKHYTEFICGQEGVLRHWLKKGVCGWRLDVADELPDEFLDNVRYAIKRERPDAFIIGEVWENAATKISYGKRKRYFSSRQLDSVTNYPLRNAIIDFLKGGDPTRLVSVILELISTYPTHVLNSLMNILGTHDTERIRTILGDYSLTNTREERAHAINLSPLPSRLKVMLAATLQFTLPGIPCIYYGDEAGLEGFEDPFNRRGYPWGNEDKTLVKFYKQLGKIRLDNREVFARGETEIIYADSHIFAFNRRLDNKTITTIVNLSNSDYSLHSLSGTNLFTGTAFNGIIPPLTPIILIS